MQTKQYERYKEITYFQQTLEAQRQKYGNIKHYCEISIQMLYALVYDGQTYHIDRTHRILKPNVTAIKTLPYIECVMTIVSQQIRMDQSVIFDNNK